jgi:hypothetical protein
LSLIAAGGTKLNIAEETLLCKQLRNFYVLRKGQGQKNYLAKGHLPQNMRMQPPQCLSI